MSQSYNKMDNFVNLVDGRRLPSMGKKWKPLIPIKKDEYLTPDTLKISVLKSPEVKRLCKYYANGNSKKEAELLKTIAGMLDEIGFKRNMAIIRFLGSVLNKILLQATPGLFVNQLAIRSVKGELAKGRCPILYLPSHRSYADFVLMSYICFVHDIEIPAIAAGMDFHGMAGMGTMLRYTGAFFMRRSFNTDRLYWDVFREYVRTLMIDYHSGLEFFIEGTRSRSCKALTPKIGLFSMALEPFLTRKVFDVTIIPVGVSYDKPVEEQLFAYELLGVPKPKESTKGLVSAFEKIETNHGRMFVNFGEPMSLVDYFSGKAIYCPPMHDKNSILTKDRLRMISELSSKVVDDQQKLIVLSTFNLIATCFSYLTMLNEKVTLQQLRHYLSALADFLKKSGALLSLEIAKNIDREIGDALGVHSNILAIQNEHLNLVVNTSLTTNSQAHDPKKLKGHDLSPRTMRCSVSAILLQIHINPCLYWLHRPAFYILSRRIVKTSDCLAEVRRLMDIFVTEFVTNKNIQDGTLLQSFAKYEAQGLISNIELSSTVLSSIVPFIFCYRSVADVILREFTGKTFVEKELLVKVQMDVERCLSESKPFVHPYCLSLDSISNALYAFTINNWITKTPATSSSPVVFTADRTKLADIRNHLDRYCSHLTEFNALNNYLVLAKL